MYKNSRHHLKIKRYSNIDEILTQQVTVKTRPANWLSTTDPVIVPFSIHSALYDGIIGDFKVASLLQTIKSGVKGKITILLCEGAHLQTLSHKYDNDTQKALQICHNDSRLLFKRFNVDFVGCNVVHWGNFVNKDEYYSLLKDKILYQYENDDIFKSKVKKDAEKYIQSQVIEKQSSETLLKSAILDLLEQCIYLIVASKQGYKFEFYPGKRNESVDHINSTLLNDHEKLSRINVTLGSPKDYVKEN